MVDLQITLARELTRPSDGLHVDGKGIGSVKNYSTFLT